MTSAWHTWLCSAWLVGLLAGCGGLVEGADADGMNPPTTTGSSTPDDSSSTPGDASSAPGDASSAPGDATTVCATPAEPVAAGCPCSRSACSPPSMDCPRGAGTSTTTRLGPAGGTASIDGTPSTVGVPFSVDVFPNSLSVEVSVKLSELTASTPDGFVDFSPIYAIEPASLAFTNGGALRIPWRVPHAGGGQVPRSLAVYAAASEDGPWQPLADSYTNAGFSQATVLAGGYFFVGYPKPDAACE